ncbi:hypothetical protein Anas_01349 [Armadillidium nasatum]|uniref:Uncharacterized protein n=1 Tax=Armadillidium nasatum TaxID=96803 RepID=A0A5N5TKY9_9CRUS|nr:hypothetical protein Anas_01349 [Armadillidium nasatum]
MVCSSANENKKSFPVFSPDGAAFPNNSWTSRQFVYKATLLSDLKPVFIRVEAPQPGDWFMAAFTVGDNSKIIQAIWVSGPFDLDRCIQYKNY